MSELAHPEPVARRGSSAIGWLIPGLVVILVLFVAPFALVFWKSFTDPTPGLQNYVIVQRLVR